MLIRELEPGWVALPTGPLLERVPFHVLHALVGPISDWYKAALPMWAVLRFYGDDVGPYDQEKQLRCRLPTHGGADSRPSARYYAQDYKTHGAFGGIHCWKPECKRKTSFWYVYAMEKARSEARYSDVFLFIEHWFRVPFPRDIVLDADPERVLVAEADTAAQDDLARRFLQAGLLRRRLKGVDRATFAAAMAEIALGRTVAGAGHG